MAWPTRSKALGLIMQAAPVAVTWYSLGGPAASKTWLVKFVTFWNNTGATRTMVLAHTRAGVRYPITTAAVANGGIYNLVCNVVLEAGDTLEVEIVTGGGTAMSCAAYGALLG